MFELNLFKSTAKMPFFSIGCTVFFIYPCQLSLSMLASGFLLFTTNKLLLLVLLEIVTALSAYT